MVKCPRRDPRARRDRTRKGTRLVRQDRHTAPSAAILPSCRLSGAGIHRATRQAERIDETRKTFANTAAEPLDTVFFTAKKMRRRTRPSANRIVVCTSLSTFAYSLLTCESPGVFR